MAKKYLTDEELAKIWKEEEDEYVDMSDESIGSSGDPDYQPSSSSDDEDVSFSLEKRPLQPRSPSPVAQGTSASSPRPGTSKDKTPPPRSPSPTPTGVRTAIRPTALGNARDYNNIVWSDPCGKQQQFPFTGKGGMDPTVAGILALAQPIDYFELFLSQEILDLMAEETNLYATQVLVKGTDVGHSSRLHDWVPTDYKEMRKFIALLGWMGVVKVPELSDYWSKNKLFSFELPRNVMSRNRFELLLRFWHFADNDNAEPGNRLHKIETIFNMFIKNFQSAFTPTESICIDETMIPFRGRLSFRQYIPSKRHRYGIKLYKLCTEKGYTWNASIYIGKDKSPESNTLASETVVLRLIKDLLDEGRTLYLDNFYSSIPLSYKLLEHKTHSVGTWRSNRQYFPREVKDTKLTKGQIIAKESPEGVTVLKWCDKRDVRMVSTCHRGDETVVTRSKSQIEKIKPKCVVDYDNGKSPVDVSDQLASYATALRRCNKWYRKLVMEVLWGTSIVNAHYLYNLNCVNSNNMSITDYRQKVILSLLEDVDATENTPNRKKRSVTHHLIRHELKKRGRCANCYENLGKHGKIVDGKKKMAAQVVTICDTCEGNPYFCRPCFNNMH